LAALDRAQRESTTVLVSAQDLPRAAVARR
jgi:hypothetical protein